MSSKGISVPDVRQDGPADYVAAVPGKAAPGSGNAGAGRANRELGVWRRAID